MVAVTRAAITCMLLCVMPLALFASPRVQSLLEQADQVRSADPARFARLLTELSRGEHEASPEQVEKLTYLRAYADVYAGRCDAAVRRAEQLIRTGLSEDVKARSSALMVNCYASSRQFLRGLRELDRLFSLTARASQSETSQHSLFAAANLYNQVGQYRLGLLDVTALLGKSGPVSPRNRCFSEQLRLDLLERLGELPPDEVPIQKLIDLCLALGEPMVANFGRIVLANQKVAAGHRSEAEAILLNNLAQMEATRYPRLITQAKALLAEFLLADGNLHAAQTYASQAVAGGTFDRAILPLVNAHKVLYEVAQRRGDVVAALEHYRAFAEADKAYLNEIKTRELAYQIVRQENQQKNQQIELLNRRNRVLQLQQTIDKSSAQNSRLLMLLATVLALVLGLWAYKTRRLHASLRKMAETDALTGVCNRHHFTLQTEKALFRCAANGEPVALVMFDLDHFKTVNDSYGHNTGDWALKRVAEACRHFCRPIDHLGRLGGEEFAILLHGCDLKAAMRIAEDCRVRISRIDSSESGYTFPVTASFGVSSTLMSGYDLDRLLSHADQMLYRAKREGRNRVRAYVPDFPMEMSEQRARRDDAVHSHTQDTIGVPVSTLSA